MTLKNTIKFNDIKRETFEILNKNPNISSMAMEYYIQETLTQKV